MPFRNILIAVGILLITPFAVKAEEAAAIGDAGGDSAPAAATTSTIPVAIPEEAVTLHLDAGFVGRPASFDLFDGRVVISWDAKTLVAPATFVVTRTRGGAGQAGQIEAAKGVAIHFDGNGAVSAKGKMRLSFKADRPPTNVERVAAMVFSDSASSTSAVAAYAKDFVTVVIGAIPTGSVVPYFENGIMTSGLASWYNYKHCNCAASPDVPKGTKLKVSRQDDPSQFVIVTVNDYGPDRAKHPERVIDLDKVAFAKIGNPRGGVLAVRVEPVDPLNCREVAKL
jgi:hypothetical protein